MCFLFLNSIHMYYMPNNIQGCEISAETWKINFFETVVLGKSRFPRKNIIKDLKKGRSITVPSKGEFVLLLESADSSGSLTFRSGYGRT